MVLPAHLKRVVNVNHELAVDFLQRLGFFLQSQVVVIGQGHLENELLLVFADE